MPGFLDSQPQMTAVQLREHTRRLLERLYGQLEESAALMSQIKLQYRHPHTVEPLLFGDVSVLELIREARDAVEDALNDDAVLNLPGPLRHPVLPGG